jgi:histidine ammonia-lyase
MMAQQVVIGQEKLSIEAVTAAAKKERSVVLDPSAEFSQKIEEGARFLDEALEQHGGIYGVTTGYGLGAFFDEEATRAIMIVRLNTLSQGFSGVSIELLRSIQIEASAWAAASVFPGPLNATTRTR